MVAGHYNDKLIARQFVAKRKHRRHAFCLRFLCVCRQFLQPLAMRMAGMKESLRKKFKNISKKGIGAMKIMNQNIEQIPLGQIYCWIVTWIFFHPDFRINPHPFDFSYTVRRLNN